MIQARLGWSLRRGLRSTKASRRSSAVRESSPCRSFPKCCAERSFGTLMLKTSIVTGDEDIHEGQPAFAAAQKLCRLHREAFRKL